MKLYAELGRVRRRQILSDAAAGGGIVLSIVLGVLLRGLVAVAAAPGQLIEDAGEAVGGVIGGGGIGNALVDAGRAQQDAVLSVAFWLGFGVALLGIAAVLLAHLPRRLAWMRESSAAARLREQAADLHLLAYRAMARRPLTQLADAVPAPGAPLTPQDARRLAGMELEALGLRPPSQLVRR